MNFKNALVSVSDKTGLLDFLRPLVANGLRVVSTGGTYKFLCDNGIPAVEIAEQTGFPEVMGGRVKTLHPKVHMALLSRDGLAEDEAILNSFSLAPFDLLICNLYPFEAALAGGAIGADLIEKIDIGGPSMLRSAAKNFQRLTVVCDPQDYNWISAKDNFELSDRQRLSAKVFAHTSAYDSLIAQSLGAGWGPEWSLAGRVSGTELRYGENPQQAAKWYKNLGDTTGLHSAEVIQGKALSYNNILDLDAAVVLVRSFADPSCVAIKHNNPCGVATRDQLSEAVKFAIEADPVSVFGAIVALNKKVDAQSAHLLSEIFLECVVAPDFSTEAMDIFSKKKNLRVLKWPTMLTASREFELRGVFGGFLLQSIDHLASAPTTWKFLGQKPNDQVTRDLIFAEKICASLKSNAIAIVGAEQTLGLGMGQVNRVEAVAQAIARLHKHHSAVVAKKSDLVMASDAFFPFADSIEVAAAAGVRWVLQPGGSIKDEAVFSRAQELGVEMVITGVRHFRH